jgi:hypothetical protein
MKIELSHQKIRRDCHPDGQSCRKQFSTRQILNAKLPEPGGGSTVEQSDCED